MSTIQNANNKLLVLYLINRFPGQTESDLVSLALSSLYLDYFTFFENLTQLSEQNLVFRGHKKADQRKDIMGRTEERLYLTEQGEKILLELQGDLPLPMKATVDRLREDSKGQLEIKDNIIATIKAETDGYYRLALQLMNGLESRFSLNLRLPDAELCKKMAKHWKSNSYTIYNDILAILNDDTAKDEESDKS